jgi:hypothetical protein
MDGSNAAEDLEARHRQPNIMRNDLDLRVGPVNHVQTWNMLRFSPD